MKQPDRQAGFSAVIVIAAALALAGTGFVAWRISQAHNSPQTQQEQKQENNPVEDKYLVIKEWGVRFELPENLRGDISYFMNTRATEMSGGPTFVSLVSKKFSVGDLKCAIKEGDEPRELLNLLREVEGEGGETLEPAPFKQVDNARFYFLGSGCQEAIAREGSAENKQLLFDLKNAVTNTLEVDKD